MNVYQSIESVLLSYNVIPSMPILKYSFSLKPLIFSSIVTNPPFTGSSISGKALSNNFCPYGNPTPESSYYSRLTCHPCTKSQFLILPRSLASEHEGKNSMGILSKKLYSSFLGA